jgi:hypothetical protein
LRTYFAGGGIKPDQRIDATDVHGEVVQNLLA